MGFSCSSIFFCKITHSIMSYEAKVKVKNYFEKLGLESTIASMRASFMAANDLLASSPHLISESFLNIKVIFLTITTNLGTNLLKKFTLPRKDWISFLFMGILIFWIASILSGSMQNTSCSHNIPNKLAFFHQNKYFWD